MQASIIRTITNLKSAGMFMLASLIALFFVYFGWTGFLESDDLAYARAAQGWLAHFPYIGDSHWSLRHAIVLPIAALFGFLGVSEATLVAPIVIYTALLVYSVFAITRWAGDPLAGGMAALTMASVPIIAEGASMVYTDSVEALFVCLSLFSFVFAKEQSRVWRWYVAAGLFAGLAFITRETMIALLACYAVLFLIGHSGRSRYFIMAAGFLAVVLADALYLGIASGDPLYRFTISLKGVAGDNPTIAAFATVKDGFDRHGIFQAPAVLQPVLMLFANRNFGPLFWIAVPAAVMLLRAASVPEKARELARLAVMLAVIWFVVLAYGLYWLWDVPRYHTVVVVMAAIIVGLWLRYVVWPWRPLAACAALIGIMAVHSTLIMLANKDPLFGERALTALAVSSKLMLHTDPSTFEGAEFLLEISGSRDRVTAALPQSGDLYVYNSQPYRRRPGLAGPMNPAPDWVVLQAIEEQPKLIARLLAASGFAQAIPNGIAKKLAPPLRRIVLYRLPPNIAPAAGP